jgi:hypothetical protein
MQEMQRVNNWNHFFVVTAPTTFSDSEVLPSNQATLAAALVPLRFSSFDPFVAKLFFLLAGLHISV